MFTINIYLKFALIAVFLGGGLVLSFLYGLGYSWILILIGLILLVSYILLGTVQSATLLVQSEQFDAADQRLNLTLNPKWLYPTNRAFYYIIKGSIASFRKDNDQAEAYLKDALAIKLPSDNEKAMVLLQLAGINAQRNKWTQAEHYFREAKKLKITERMIKSQFDEFEKAFAQRGQMKAVQRMGGAQGRNMMTNAPSGKRRRPKMR